MPKGEVYYKKTDNIFVEYFGGGLFAVIFLIVGVLINSTIKNASIIPAITLFLGPVVGWIVGTIVFDGLKHKSDRARVDRENESNRQSYEEQMTVYNGELEEYNNARMKW